MRWSMRQWWQDRQHKGATLKKSTKQLYPKNWQKQQNKATGAGQWAQDFGRRVRDSMGFKEAFAPKGKTVTAGEYF